MFGFFTLTFNLRLGLGLFSIFRALAEGFHGVNNHSISCPNALRSNVPYFRSKYHLRPTLHFVRVTSTLVFSYPGKVGVKPENK